VTVFNKPHVTDYAKNITVQI